MNHGLQEIYHEIFCKTVVLQMVINLTKKHGYCTFTIIKVEGHYSRLVYRLTSSFPEYSPLYLYFKIYLYLNLSSHWWWLKGRRPHFFHFGFQVHVFRETRAFLSPSTLLQKKLDTSGGTVTLCPYQTALTDPRRKHCWRLLYTKSSLTGKKRRYFNESYDIAYTGDRQ